MMGSGENSRVENLVGKTIDGKWVLKERLGSGGMAPVYRAERRQVPIVRAVKILPPMQVGTVFEDRFFDEIRATAMIRHESVIRIDDFGVCRDIDPKGVLYYVMDWIVGRNVSELMEEGALPPRWALLIALGVARGLCAAHGASPPVLHRDIKPENIMIEDSTGRVVVLDFGIAKFRRTDAEGREVQPLTQRREVWSTPQYMSPEQATGNDELTVATDIYSLGVVLYEMLCGQPLFDGQNRLELKEQHLRKRPTPLLKLQHGVDPRINEFVMRLLAKRPQQRPPNTLAVLRSIEELLARLPDDSTWPPKVSKRPRRRKSPPPKPAIPPRPPPGGVEVIGSDPDAFCGCARGGKLPLRLHAVMLSGPADPVVYELQSEHVVIGRAPDASGSGVEDTITVMDPDDLVSRRHAALHRQVNDIMLYDLDSINRTEVNGKLIENPTPLRLGDLIVLGTAVKVAVGDRSSRTGDFFHFCRDRHANEPGARFCSQCAAPIEPPGKRGRRK